MPPTPSIKQKHSKPSPYPARPPSTAGPSNTSGSTATSTSIVPLSQSKKEIRKARRASSGMQSMPAMLIKREPSETKPTVEQLRADKGVNGVSEGAEVKVKTEPGDVNDGMKKRKKQKKKKRDSTAGSTASTSISGSALPIPPVNIAASSTVDLSMSVEPPLAYRQPDQILSNDDQAPSRTLTQTTTNFLSQKPPRPLLSANDRSLSPTKHHISLKEGRVSKLVKQLEEVREAAEKEKAAWEAEKKEMEGKMREMEEKMEKEKEEVKGQAEEKDKVIEQSMKTLDTLREAASCGVCLDTFKDPHILSCGHIACKECLVNWFRTPVAYMHEIPDSLDGIAPTRDVSYRTKVCHVCRVGILRRPSRMYHFDSILEPLGINPQLPTLSQAAKEEEQHLDPWHNLFPAERESYKIVDPEDGIARCPECLGEIDGDMCDSCDIEFSEDEWDEYGDGEVLSEGSEVDQMQDGWGGGDVEDEGIVDLEMDSDTERDNRRRELAVQAEIDADIWAQERRIRRNPNQSSMFDLEASDGEGGEDDEEDDYGSDSEGGDPWDKNHRHRGGSSGSSAMNDEEEDDDDTGIFPNPNFSDEEGVWRPPPRLSPEAGLSAADIIRAAAAPNRRLGRPRAEAGLQPQRPRHGGGPSARIPRQRDRDPSESSDDSADDADLRLAEDEAYEDSFIDDEEIEERSRDDEGDESLGVIGQKGNDSASEAGSEMDISRMRARRVERFQARTAGGKNIRSPSPLIRSSAPRRRNRAVIDPDSD